LKIEYILVTPENSEKYQKGFIETYKEAFGGPPYFEIYTDSDVAEGIWIPHLRKGIIIVACKNDSVVGFICAIPLLKAPQEIQNYLMEKRKEAFFPTKFEDVWYISELGVRRKYRRRGIATRLVKECLTKILKLGGRYYVLRTATNNVISQRLFKNFGAIELPGTQDVSSSAQVKVHQSKSTQRVYLYGNCEMKLKQ
jgi:ribosomal protein S18 acetylase RimI-like enzyme